MLNGTYSLISPHYDRNNHDMDCHVEGLRENWQDTLVRNYNSLPDEASKQGYLAALYVLKNSFMPAAYQRSLPIARLEEQFKATLHNIVRQGKCSHAPLDKVSGFHKACENKATDKDNEGLPVCESCLATERYFLANEDKALTF